MVKLFVHFLLNFPIKHLCLGKGRQHLNQSVAGINVQFCIQVQSSVNHHVSYTHAHTNRVVLWKYIYRYHMHSHIYRPVNVVLPMFENMWVHEWTCYYHCHQNSKQNKKVSGGTYFNFTPKHIGTNNTAS